MRTIKVLDLTPLSSVIRVKTSLEAPKIGQDGFWDDECYDLFMQEHDPANEVERYED